MPFSKLKGRKLMLCNMIYQRPSKITDWHDYIIVVYRDMVLGTKETFKIQDPEIDIYSVKPEFRTFKKPRHFMPLNKLDKVTIKYKNVYREIAKIAGKEYMDYYNTHTQKERKNLFKYPYVLGADIDIETYYRFLWAETFGRESPGTLSKAYFDIEVDQMYYEGSMAKHGECPINAISIVDDKANIAYEFLLDDPNNPQIAEFKRDIKEFYQDLHDSFDPSYGEMEYKIYMIEDETELIRQAFKLVRTISDPDFFGGWNIFGYDIRYILDRARVLGIDPAELVCDPSFPNQHYYFFDDTNSFEFANKRSYFATASRQFYSDMTINYASLRKSRGAVKRVNLGYVAQKELKDTKLDYSDAGNIRTLPYTDYKRFVKYSIKDSLLLMGIDRTCKDTDNLYLIANTNYVPYKDALKQTVVFRALMFGYLKQLGIILGHNVNFDTHTGGKYDENGERINVEDEEDDSFEGAINGDTMLNNANGVKLYGIPSMFLYLLVIDFDFSARHMALYRVIYRTNLSNLRGRTC